MKSILTGTVIGALSFALATAAFAAGRGATSPMASGNIASPMAPRTPTTTTTTMSPTHKSQPTATASSTTQRGPSSTGQPSQNCETLGNQPGNAISAPGSAFNPNGTAGGVYAGNQPQSSGNTASVSQYDVACARP